VHNPVLPSMGRPKIFREIGSVSACTGALAASKRTPIKTLFNKTIASDILRKRLDFLYDILHSNGHSKNCNCGVLVLADLFALLHREKGEQRRRGIIRRYLVMSKRMNCHANHLSTWRFTSRKVTPVRNHRRCVGIFHCGGSKVPEKHK